MKTLQLSPIQIGDKGFGAILGYPPATWRYDGLRSGSHVLSHASTLHYSRRYPDQYVTLATAERIMSNPR